jgi:hypothetical protein
MSMVQYARGAQLVIAKGRPVSGDAKPKALTTQLAIEKALAHVDDPVHYPLPDDPTTPENVLAARLMRIPPLRRRRMVKEALDVFRAQRRRMPLGALGCIDLGSNEPVLAQAKTLLKPTGMAFTEVEEQNLTERVASINGDFGLTYLWASA